MCIQQRLRILKRSCRRQASTYLPCDYVAMQAHMYDTSVYVRYTATMQHTFENACRGLGLRGAETGARVALDAPALFAQGEDADHNLLHVLGLIQIVCRKVVDVLDPQRFHLLHARAQQPQQRASSVTTPSVFVCSRFDQPPHTVQQPRTCTCTLARNVLEDMRTDTCATSVCMCECVCAQDCRAPRPCACAGAERPNDVCLHTYMRMCTLPAAMHQRPARCTCDPPARGQQAIYPGPMQAYACEQGSRTASQND